MRATRDRADVIHFAGWHDLSPALREDGGPALVALVEQTGRCGWEPFFRAMEERDLALELDAAGTFRFVSAGHRRPFRRRPGRASPARGP